MLCYARCLSCLVLRISVPSLTLCCSVHLTISLEQQQVVFFQKARTDHVKITKPISPESFGVFLDCRLPVLVLEEVVSDILDILSNSQDLFHLNKRMVNDCFYLFSLFIHHNTKGNPVPVSEERQYHFPA